MVDLTEENYDKLYLKYKKKYLKLYNENKDLLDAYQKGGNQNNGKFITFTAKWCHHCKVLSPTLKALAKTQLGGVKLINYDSEEHQHQIEKYKIGGFPTIIFEKNNKIIEYDGDRSKDDLINFIKKHNEN